MASQLKQFSIPPQSGAAGCVSENVTSSKFQGAEWKAGYARTTQALAIACLHVEVWSAAVSLLINLGNITMKNKTWELAAWHINKLLCE